MFEEILNNASNQASVYQSEDDYTKDGLIHCSLCNTPKQTKINMLGNERIVFCLCKCQMGKCEEEQNELKKEEKQIELRRYKETCFDDSKFINIKFKTHGKSMYRCYVTAYKYTQYFETAKKCGFGLTIHGERGSGKTYLTACIANELLDKNYSVYMTSLSNLFNLMSKNYGEHKQDVLKKIETVDLLIIDDVGTERNSPTDMGLMFEVFNKRDVSGKPLIITTNLKLDEFTKNPNQDYRRAYERILSKTTNVLSDMPNMRLSLAEDAKTQFNKFLKGE